MSEKEKKIMETLARAVKGASESRKDYLLGWAEGAASTAPSERQEEAEKAPV